MEEGRHHDPGNRPQRKGEMMKTRNERSSLRIGRIAARVLATKVSDGGLTVYNMADVRALAASVLTQLPDKVKVKLGVK